MLISDSISIQNSNRCSPFSSQLSNISILQSLYIGIGLLLYFYYNKKNWNTQVFLKLISYFLDFLFCCSFIFYQIYLVDNSVSANVLAVF